MTTDIQPRRQPPCGEVAALPGRRPDLRPAIGERLLIAGGAMGSVLQGSPTTLDDFAGCEGCNEALGRSDAELAEAEGRPRPRMWLERIQTEGLFDAGVAYGYFPAVRHQGCRYAFGYPACPDPEDRATAMRLLEPERIGITLSEDFQLAPEQSTDAVIAHHPEANYSST